jgi:hypothetical protein
MNTLPTISFLRSSIPGKIPTPEKLPFGQFAINTYDADVYVKRFRTGIGTDVVRVGAGATVSNLIWVTPDGNDNNSGLKMGDAKATIKAAVADSKDGTVIRVTAGTYEEDNPIKLPPQVSVVGDSLREVTVVPKNNADLFFVGRGNYITGMSFIKEENTYPLAIAAFDPENKQYINQSTYVQNCTNFIPNSIGLRINGNHAIGPIKSMVLDSFTQYNANGIGISITNEGYAQLVSLFTICSDTSVYCDTGGSCDLTNSNSSFGNKALVANGVGPLKYTGILTSPIISSDFIFEVDVSTPTFNVTDADYNNITGVVQIDTNFPHKFTKGMSVEIVGLGFSCNSGPGIVTYPDTKGGKKVPIFEVIDTAPGRYLDAADRIEANRKEILDKSLVGIALSYSDFIYPDDPLNDLSYRYKDATRLILKNKDEIVGVAWTNTYYRFPCELQNIPNVESKCRRDLGYFVDAVSTDLYTGGNYYSIEFVKQYFNTAGIAITNGLVGEEVPSVYAFNLARDLMKQAITNQLTYQEVGISSGPAQYNGSGGNVPNTSPNACTDVQNTIDTLVSIITTVIGSGSLLSLDNITVNPGIFLTGENVCRRDLGYVLDAIISDLRSFTNRQTLLARDAYFDQSGIVFITSEREQSIVGFTSLREYSKLAINNQLNIKDFTLIADPLTQSNNDPNSCSDVKSFIDNLVSYLIVDLTNQTKGNYPTNLTSQSFKVNVGVSTLEHYYVSGGTVKNYISRPYDGQVLYFDRLYSDVASVEIINGGSGYEESPEFIFSEPEEEWGIPAQAVATIRNGTITEVNLVSSGRGYLLPPTLSLTTPNAGITTASFSLTMKPTYFSVTSSTPISSSGITTITLNENIPYEIAAGAEVYFYRQSRILASSHCMEYIGTGTTIERAIPVLGGVPIQENETISKDGGLVVFTTTDQAGNFRIGDGVVINQNTGRISGTDYTKSLFATMTPFILSLGGD